MEEQNKRSMEQTVEEIVIDFGDICRFCLIETSSRISIFDKCLTDDFSDSPQDSIYNFIRKFSSVKVEGSENFPSLVCENCYELVKVCYRFSQVCQQSDFSLRECYEKTLKETKAKLNYSEKPIMDIKSDEVPVSVDVLLPDVKLSELIHSKDDINQNKPIKWKPISGRKSKTLLSIQADNIKLKYQKMNSLSERLKEAQTKLAEDILRSNDMMLELPKSEELSKALRKQKSPFACPECSVKFNSPEALKFHYIGTHGQTRKFKTVTKFQCKKCVKSFSEQTKLVIHYKNIHKMKDADLSEEHISYKVKKTVWIGKRKFYCLHCVPYKIYRTRRQLVEHLKERHEMNSVSKSVSKLFSCGRCKNETSFASRFSLNRHFQLVHKLKEEDITLQDIKYKPEIDENQKLYKVFLCMDCSPPVSFTSISACVQHKTETHDKQMENIPLKELSAVYVDSLDVFKSSAEETSGFCFKVLCKNCIPPMEFTSTNEFVNHMYAFHDETTLENWDIEYKSGMEVKEESGQWATHGLWKCPECSVTYYRRQSLNYHMKEKHNKSMQFGAMKCPECTETFFTNRQLIQHGITAHQKYFANFHKVYTKNFVQTSCEEENRKKNFECDICQKKYVCKNSLKRHILKIHLGKVESEAVVCPYCGKTLSNKLNLKSHIEFVHEALFVSCPICKKRINFKTIGKHYKTHQSNSELIDSRNRFLCNLCGKILKSKRSFEDHQNLHKNIRDQLCDICGSGFTTKKFLLLHKKTHEGVQRKVFNCDQCDKVFSGRHTLNRHLLTHSGEKNFICEICSKCFYTLQELNRHVRYHKKEYRFDCPLCAMRFLDKSRFRHHMMKHKNVRPHKCQFCDKMFIVRGKMNLHMAAKHNVEVQNTKAVWKDPKTYVPLDDLL